MAHGLDTLLEAAALLSDREDIVFLMAGDGAERERLQAAIASRGLANVKMLGQLPKAEMPKLWSCSDVSLVLLRKQALFTTVIPSKIFESMAMKKPIVLGVEGEAARIITEGGSGICIEPENAAQLAEAVRSLADDAEHYAALADAGHEYVATHFDRTNLAAEYESVLRQVSGLPVPERPNA